MQLGKRCAVWTPFSRWALPEFRRTWSNLSAYHFCLKALYLALCQGQALSDWLAKAALPTLTPASRAGCAARAWGSGSAGAESTASALCSRGWLCWPCFPYVQQYTSG